MLSGACDGICSIELGFTICFLNSNFVKTILEKEKDVLPYEIDVANCSSPTCTAVFEKSVHKIYWENGSITQKMARQSGHRYPIQECGPHQAQAGTIKSSMENFKENMHCQYPEDGAPTPGVVLVNSNGKVVGIHIGKMKKKKDEVEITGGINIYSVIELLRGKLFIMMHDCISTYVHICINYMETDYSWIIRQPVSTHRRRGEGMQLLYRQQNAIAVTKTNVSGFLIRLWQP